MRLNHTLGIDQNRRKARLLALTALAAALLIGVQLCLIAWQGEAACFNEGCLIVEGLTRVSPFVFNLFGLLFFLVVGLMALTVQDRPLAARFLSLLLLAAMAGEGVLLAYQYQVALTWCSYCLTILGLVAFCNLLVGLRQLFSALVLVAAVNIIFAMLTFEPAQRDAGNRGLAAGTAAVLPGPVAGRSVFLIYSKDCPHCLALLRKLPEFADCTIRLNPVGDAPRVDIPGLEPMADYLPKNNLQLLRVLQIDAVPVLVVPENGGYRIIRSESGIEAYLQANCTESVEAAAPVPETSAPEKAPLPDLQSLLPPAGDKECSVDVECAEPLPPYPDQEIPAR
jgi:thiol-disulfide isomerase/thioredoxin